MIELSVNLNKVALLRNSREGDNPRVTEAARTVIAAGAYGVTVHPRPDQRHIRPHDVIDLAELLANEAPHIELNIEGNPLAGPRDNGFPGFDALIAAARPAQCTLVPDSDDQLTSDHGWPLESSAEIASVAELTARYQATGARVSLFMDPEPDRIDRVPETGAERIELYTGPFAEAVWDFGVESTQAHAALARYRQAADHATALGLGVNAGHDLDLLNLPLFRTITAVLEVSIGHALIADALAMGLDAAVRAYLAALENDR
jgi:pyridoxine 5-phosphate synthase